MYQEYINYQEIVGTADTMGEIGFYGVIIGLAIAIFFIIMKLSPVVGMLLGTVTGAIIGGLSISDVWYLLTSGTRSVAGVLLSIIAAGVMVGVLVETGAAETIARTIVNKLGEKRAVLAVALSCAIMLASGVFITVSIVMLSPIALSVGQKAKLSKASMLLALSGGAKAGNIISPNPNAVGVADTFGVTLGQLMVGGFVPFLVAMVATVIVAGLFAKRGAFILESEVDDVGGGEGLPSFWRAVSAPAIAVGLLMLSPIGDLLNIDFLANFQLEAFFVLPLAAAIGTVIMGRARDLASCTNKGVQRMMPIVLLLIGAGVLGRLVLYSEVPGMLVSGMNSIGLPGFLLAPISGALMAFSASSTAMGAILAAEAFAETVLGFGIPALYGAVMLHAGAMFIDVMPHGNVFLGSQESMKFTMKERIKLIPFEAAIGGALMLAAIIMYGVVLG